MNSYFLTGVQKMASGFQQFSFFEEVLEAFETRKGPVTFTSKFFYAHLPLKMSGLKNIRDLGTTRKHREVRFSGLVTDSVFPRELGDHWESPLSKCKQSSTVQK